MAITSRSALSLQGAVLFASVALATLVPPAEGEALLVPLGAGAAARIAPLALAHGSRLVARGPLPGSLVVEGSRARLWITLLRAGIVMTAAPPVGCGERAG